MAHKKYLQALRLAKRSKPDWDQVRQLLESAFEDDCPHAAYALATWYLHGTHVLQNAKTAARLLKIAAAENVPEAHYDLAVSYETGNGVAKSLRKAFHHYLASALHGDVQGMRETGRCYWHGMGIPKDRKTARLFIKRALELGAKN